MKYIVTVIGLNKSYECTDIQRTSINTVRLMNPTQYMPEGFVARYTPTYVEVPTQHALIEKVQ